MVVRHQHSLWCRRTGAVGAAEKELMPAACRAAAVSSAPGTPAVPCSVLCAVCCAPHPALLCVCVSCMHTGIMLFRSKALPFVDEWIKVIEADESVWDQNAFNELVRKGQQILPDDPHHYFKGEGGEGSRGVWGGGGVNRWVVSAAQQASQVTRV